MTTTKAFAIFMALIVAMTIVGFAYAHWTDIVYINGSVKMGHVRVGIESEKVLTSKEVQKYSTITYNVSADKHTLNIYCTNVKECWYIWVGLVTQNKGLLPANIKSINYSYEDPNGFKDYFETKEYFYGPYPEATGFGTLEVWDGVWVIEDLLPNGTVTFVTTPHTLPLPLDPYEKAVIWIWIHCKAVPDDGMGKSITMYINIVDDLAI